MYLRTGTALSVAFFIAFSAFPQELKLKSEVQKAFEDGLVKGTASAEGVTTKYALYVPPGYDASKPWPLILFLHGAGERGDDGLLQTRVGIGPVIREHPDEFPCLVLMPQCLTNYFWPAEKSELPVQDAVTQMEELPDTVAPAGWIRDALEQVEKNYNVDRNRIALTGLSMGGFGAFKFGADHIDEFSCVMPICGGGNPDLAAALAKRPMRVFHGGADPVVAPQRSIQMVDAIKAAGGNVTYTEFPGVQHNSWVKAYADPDNIAWLLTQRRP